jgi:hypothetical protein
MVDGEQVKIKSKFMLLDRCSCSYNLYTEVVPQSLLNNHQRAPTSHFTE